MPEVERLDDLYGVDPAEFVSARDALARRLRASGDTALASEVKALRRPPKSAWALNALARSDAQVIDAVIAAAAALGDAFQGGGDLRAAQAAYRDAIHDAVSTAADRAGIDAESLRTRMRDTLFAAGADPDVAHALASGTLRDDHEAPGFGVGPGAAPAPEARGVRSARSQATHPSGPDDARPSSATRTKGTAEEPARSSAAARLAAPARRGRTLPAASRTRAPAAAARADTTAPADAAAPADTSAAPADTSAAADAGEVAPQRSELERRADLRRQRDLDREADRLRRKADRLRADVEAAEARALAARREADAAEAAAAAKEREADEFRDERGHERP